MIDKKKIIKVDVYSFNNELIVSSEIFNIMPIDHIDEQFSVIIKNANLPEIPMNTPVKVVFYYINGDRVKYDTRIDVCTEFQLNVTIGTSSTLLEERRRFYKLATDLEASISIMTRGEEDTVFDNPISARIKNINIGGVFLESTYDFRVGDIIMLKFNVLGTGLALSSKILRIQKTDNHIEGYGCQFLKLKNREEEILARYINNVQRESLDIIKNILNTR